MMDLLGSCGRLARCDGYAARDRKGRDVDDNNHSNDDENNNKRSESG